MVKVSIVNQSTLFADADLPAMANALQIQMNRDFLPAWGLTAQIYWTPTGSHPTADHWVLALLDDPDQAGALGYHDISPTGLPLGKIFVRTSLSNKVSVSSVVSHELLEQRADPDINLSAEFDDASGTPSKFYSYEVADSPETTSYFIDVPANFTGGPAKIEVSNFVFPAWFESFRKTGPFDQLGLITKPFQLLPGGYIGMLDLANLSAGWQQLLARQNVHSSREKMAARPQPGSRRSRRALRRSEWLRSTYDVGTAPPIPAEAGGT